MRLERTNHGFDFGSARVVAMAEHKGHAYIRIQTSKEILDIRVTPSGLIRIEKERGNK